MNWWPWQTAQVVTKIQADTAAMSEEDYKLGYRDGIVAGEVDRAAVIEECAWVAEQWGDQCGEYIAAAIRALKDK